MPKGVEHLWTRFSIDTRKLVRTSVMPKGVEHIVGQHLAPQRTPVRTSVMPKGVEHSSQKPPSSDV